MFRAVKKIILLFSVFISLATSAFSQNEIGIYVMPQITSLHNKANRQGDDPIYQPEVTYAYGGGVTFMHDFKKTRYGKITGGNTSASLDHKLGLKVGLFYSANDQKFTSRYRYNLDSTITHSGRKRFDYLKLPVNLRFTIPLNDRFNLALYGGPQVSWLFKAEGGIVHWVHYDTFDYYDLPFSDISYFKRFTLDAVAGIDLEYKVKKGRIGNFVLAKWVHFVFGIRADWSATTVEHKDRIINNYPSYGQVNGFSGERSNSRNSTLGFILGATYHFHKPDYAKTRF